MKELIEQYYRLILHSSAQRFALASKTGKEVKYPHQSGYLTEADLLSTIEGKQSIGIMLNQDQTGLCKAGCIDLDLGRDFKNLSEGLALAERLKEIALKSNLRGYIEFSGSRGFHFWIFSEKAITGDLMQNVLRAIVHRANFEAKEIFPNRVPVESKCIKLPGTIHLKSGNRCGFIDEEFDPANPKIDLNKQAELMAGFIQNSVEDLTAVANSSNFSTYSQSSNDVSDYRGSEIKSQPNSNNNQSHNQSEINQKLSSFGNSHPSCINHLLSNGSPLEIDYHQSNLTLIRYCLSRSISLEDALPMAQSMARNTSEAHPTSKDYQGKVSNFKSEFNSASRNSDNYQFACSYILQGIKEGEASKRGCIGTKCPIHFNHQSNNISDNSTSRSNNADSPTKYPLNRLIFQSLMTLSAEGKECCKSNIMLECERLILIYSQENDCHDELDNPDKLSDSIRLIESEVISYLIQVPDTIADCLEIFPEGFTSLEDKPLSEYIDYLRELELPSEETIEAHIDLIREQGIKTIASDKFSQYREEIKSADSVEIINKAIDEGEALLKQSLSDKQLLPVSDKLADWVSDLMSETKVSIPTFSQDLNYLLNGGLSKGKLYVLGSPPANGKSTISAQIGDLASSKGFKVAYASYEMSSEQLFLTSLSRLGQINSSLLESKKYFSDEYLQDKLFQTIREYQDKIAENIHIIEADDLYTPNRLLAIVKKLECDLLIVDYLQLLSSGDQKLDNSYQETLRVSKIATELKRVARKTEIPIIAISDINKNAYQTAIKGGDLDMGALRDSFKIAHSADVIMLLMSNNVAINSKDDDGNKSEISATQLYFLAEKFRDFNPQLAVKIDMMAHEYLLNKNTADTYSRLIIAKNRTGKCGEVLFRYSKALHYFEPLNYLSADFNFNGGEF